MPFLGTLLAKLGLDTTDFSKNLSKANADMHTFGTRAEDLGKRLTFTMSLPLLAAGKQALETAGKFEAVEIGMTKLLGSGQRAKSMMKDLFDFAANTPFEIPGAILSAQKLLATGTAADQVIPKLRAIGDAVAGLGGGEFEISRVVKALNQMSIKAKASSEEINQQLAEVGINAWKYLADAAGVSVQTIQKHVEKGLIPGVKAVEDIIKGMQKEFGGTMESQMAGYKGMLSNLKDNVTLTFKAIGDAMLPAAKNMMSGTLNPILLKVRELAGEFRDASPAVQNFFMGMGTIGVIAPPAIWFMGSMVSNLTQIAPLARSAVTALTGPVGLSVAIGTVLVGAIAYGVSHLRDLNRQLDEAFDRKENGAPIPWSKDDGKMVMLGISDQMGGVSIKVSQIKEDMNKIEEKAAKLPYHWKSIPFRQLHDDNELFMREIEYIAKKWNELGTEIQELRDPSKHSQDLLIGPEVLPRLADVTAEVRKIATEMDRVRRASDWAASRTIGGTRDSTMHPWMWDGYLDDVYKDYKKEEMEKYIHDLPERARQGVSLAAQYINRGVKQISRDLTDLVVKGSSVGEMFRAVTLDISTNVLRWALETEINIALRNLDKLIAKFGSLGAKISDVFSGMGTSGVGAASDVYNGGGYNGGTGGVGGALSGAMGGVTGALMLGSNIANAVFSGLQYFQGRRMEQDIGRMEVSLRGILNQSMSIQLTLNSINAGFTGLMEFLYGPHLSLLVEIAGHLSKIANDQGGSSVAPNPAYTAMAASYGGVNPRSVLGAQARELMLSSRRFQQI